MSDNINPELKNIIEAALLVAGQPLTIERMLAMFPQESQPSKEELREVLKRIDEDYNERGLELKQIGKGWRIQTREKYAEYVAKLLEERPPRYSRALLETLAIIAYRQPVTRGEIEDIRGVAVSTEIIRTLVERGWIKQVGVREVPGRPAIYGTTPAFLEHFNLKSLEDMPPLAELRSIDEISADLDKRAEEANVAVNAVVAEGEHSEGNGNGTAEEQPAEVSVDETQSGELRAEESISESPASELVIAEPEPAAAIEAQSAGRD